MAKLIKAVRIREDRAEMLREKAIQLTIKKKEHITEADLVNYLIDAVTESLDIDQDGIFIVTENLD